MKNVLIIITAAIALASCNGKAGADTDNTDIITVTDNGKTYGDTITWEPGGEVIAVGRATESNAMVKEATAGKPVQSANASLNEPALQCAIHKKDGKSVFTMIHAVPTAGFPMAISIANAVGPANGVGIYKSGAGVGSGGIVQANTFAETGSGPYTVDSVEVNVTKAEGTTLVSSFKMWVTAAAGSREVTGIINCNNAGID